MKKFVIIVAGGSGSRMQSDIPKQFLLLDGIPILAHTIAAFAKYDDQIEIILVLPTEHIETWKELSKAHHLKSELRLIAGGSSRYQSVKNGLDQIQEQGLVAIHDGARPLVSKKVIGRTFEQSALTGSGVAAVDVKDSLRELTSTGNRAVERAKYRAVQTPQTFKVTLIKAAFENTYSDGFTDDASVYESNGGQIQLTQGSYENIKVTTTEDLLLAEEILKKRKSLSL